MTVAVECRSCGMPVAPGATTCECGERLAPLPVEPNPIRLGPVGCTCGGNGICTPCVLDEYERGADQ